VRDDIPGSRRQSGSSSDQDGLGIPSRSARASSRDILIDKLEGAVRELKAAGDRVGHDLLLNLALGQVERAIRRWRAENPSSRYPSFPLGRPAVLDKDVEDLLALREANPGSDCRAEFEKGTSVGKQRARIRYRDADERIAEMTSKSRP
jgi:hypothetical protein